MVDASVKAGLPSSLSEASYSIDHMPLATANACEEFLSYPVSLQIPHIF